MAGATSISLTNMKIRREDPEYTALTNMIAELEEEQKVCGKEIKVLQGLWMGECALADDLYKALAFIHAHGLSVNNPMSDIAMRSYEAARE